MARITKEEKRIDAVVSAAYKRHGSFVAVNIFALSPILNAGRLVGLNGGTDEEISEAVRKEVEKHRLS